MAERRLSARALDLRYQPGFKGAALACLFCLYTPIAVLMVFSFNQNRSVTLWTEFSLRWYVRAFHNEGIQSAALISLKLALIATVVATTAAVAAALATTRVPRFRGQAVVFGMIHMPLIVPEIVTAVATLSFFALLRTEAGLDLGFAGLVLAHTVFCIPFAYLPVRARLEAMDLTLEHAAADLYADPWRAFRRITLPLLLPGIVAGAMLSFIVSLDDVIITMMVAGPGQTTLPLYILGEIRRGVTPEINAISTVLLGASVLLVTTLFLLVRKRR